MIDIERLQYFAGMLEKYMISPEKWENEVPSNIKDQLSNDGCPEGISHHPKYGWFILFCGQGPAIGWCEMGNDELEKAINDVWFDRK